MACATQLSLNDAAVLSTIFDPEDSLNEFPQINGVATGENSYDRFVTDQIQRMEREALRNVNSEKPAAPEIRSTILKLDKLIDAYPEYASAYNNRAQARRMLFEIDPPAYNTTWMSQIFHDLAQAIRIASPAHPNGHVSTEQANVLASAHTHRGFLLYRASRSKVDKKLFATLEGFSHIGQEGLEEMASRDFSAGGRYGNKAAKQLAVHTNPYAKLCGNIVKEALRKEMESDACENQ